jgi:hypothetical protein
MTQPIELAGDIAARFTRPPLEVLPSRPGSWEPRGTRSGPLSGWRVWHIWHGRSDAEALLRSPFINTPWYTAAAHTECSQHGVHTTPQPQCREGIYLFPDHDDAVAMAIGNTPLIDLAARFGFDLTYVVGQLSTPGPVTEHHDKTFGTADTLEWIAQEVRIEALYLWPNFCGTSIQPLAGELADRYEVPVTVLAFDDELDVIISRLRTNARARIGAILQ